MKRISLSLLLALFCLSIAPTSLHAQGHKYIRIPTPVKTADSVYALMSERKDLSKFVELIGDADLKSYFTGQDAAPMTVFAPTNEAISDIPHDVWKRIKADKASMQNFVKYAVISGSAVPLGSITGRRASLSSASGEDISIDGMTKKEAPTVNGAGLVATDLPASNGIVHVVNAAFIPSSVKEEPKPAPAPESAPVAQPKAAPAPSTSPIVTTTSGTVSVPTTAATTTSGTAASPLPTTTSPAGAAPAAPEKKHNVEFFGHTFSW